MKPHFGYVQDTFRCDNYHPYILKFGSLVVKVDLPHPNIPDSNDFIDCGQALVSNLLKE